MQQVEGTFALSWPDILNLDLQTHELLLTRKIAALKQIGKARRGAR